jgi:hypothetical protein
VLLSNIVVRERRPGTVEIAAMDPAATIGSLNDVDMIHTTHDLRCRLRTAIQEIDALAGFKPWSRRSTAPGGVTG